MTNRSWFRLAFIAVMTILSACLPVHAEPPTSPIQIDDYLQEKSSPLEGHGSVFLENGQRRGVDPRLVVAIAGAETTFGRHICVDFNAWNWFWKGSCPESPFASWDDGIETVTKYLRKTYFDQYKATTIPLIKAKFCVEGCENWIPLVTQFYHDELGGDLTNLGYSSPSTTRVVRSLVQGEPGQPGKDIWTTNVFSYAPGGGGPGGGRDDSELVFGGWGDEYYSLIEFDLAGLPRSASSARLEIFCFRSRSGVTTPLYLDRITQFWDWRIQGSGRDRERLWWADRPSAEPWRNTPLPAPTVGQWYSIDITDLYNAWKSGALPNYGVQLRPLFIGNQWSDFYSSNYENPEFRPRLVVVE